MNLSSTETALEDLKRLMPEISAQARDEFKNAANNKAKVTARKSHGFLTFRCHEVMLHHALGRLPVLETVHRFY
ncbi:MAG: hypothetical protein P8X74_20820 [Reinekea sp.]